MYPYCGPDPHLYQLQCQAESHPCRCPGFDDDARVPCLTCFASQAFSEPFTEKTFLCSLPGRIQGKGRRIS